MRRNQLHAGLLVLCVLLSCALACGNSEQDGHANAAVATAPGADLGALPEELVSVSPVRRGEIQTVVMATGSIRARRTTALGPVVPGRITEIFVEEGDEVAAEAPIFQIDPGPYEIGVQAAEAGLALARAQLAEAREEAERTRKLSDKKMVSDQGHRRARTRRAVASAQLEQAEAQLEQARYDLSRTLVRAPYAGTIVERNVHEGAMAMAAPGMAVVVLQESGTLEAVLDIPEASRAAVREGDALRLFLDELPEPLGATVRSVSARIDAKSRTYAVRALIDDQAGRIKAGAFVRAEVRPRPHLDALLVDRRAIVRREGRAYVFRVADGVARQRKVRIGISGQDEVEILSGVSEDDQVVVGTVVARLADGTRVRLRESPAAAAGGEPAGEAAEGPEQGS
jgi:RND family efflux transporter MFP subunit